MEFLRRYGNREANTNVIHDIVAYIQKIDDLSLERAFEVAGSEDYVFAIIPLFKDQSDEAFSRLESARKDILFENKLCDWRNRRYFPWGFYSLDGGYCKINEELEHISVKLVYALKNEKIGDFFSFLSNEISKNGRDFLIKDIDGFVKIIHHDGSITDMGVYSDEEIDGFVGRFLGKGDFRFYSSSFNYSSGGDAMCHSPMVTKRDRYRKLFDDLMSNGLVFKKD
ncbi:MAG TPA: hypothetical protein VIS94_17390 [Desulfomonilia bacterium]